jgi:NADH dehydrogenase
VHTVFHLASAQWWGRRRDLDLVDLRGTSSVITAARAARIGRLVVMSHLGAAPSSAFLLLRAKGQVEDLVRASGLAYTIFRSGIVFGPQDVFVNGVAQMLRLNPALFFQPGQGEGLLHPIYIDDLVEGLVRSMDSLSTVDQTLEVGGPEYMTFNEMVRTVMRVTSTYRSIVPVPPYLLRSFTGVMQQLFPAWPITPQWFDILASNRTASLGSMFDLFGVRPVRFEDTIITYMRGRHYTRELLQNLLRRRRHHAA